MRRAVSASNSHHRAQWPRHQPRRASAHGTSHARPPITILSLSAPLLRASVLPTHRIPSAPRRPPLSCGQVSWAFFYRVPLDEAALKSSLSATLRQIPLLSGRVRRRKPSALGGVVIAADAAASAAAYELQLCDAGIGWDHWQCDAKASEFETPAPSSGSPLAFGPTLQGSQASNRDPCVFCPRLAAGLILTGGEPLLRVRLTSCLDGTSVIGITASHVATDGASLCQVRSTRGSPQTASRPAGPHHLCATDRGLWLSS